MKCIIRNGTVVDPANSVSGKRTIYIDKGRIAGLGRAPKSFFEKPGKKIKEFDAKGCFVFPGLIDLCARLREPGQEHKATIASEARAAASGGITTVICPPDTWPVIDTPAMVNMVRDRAKSCGYSRVIPMGALTVGLEGQKLSNMGMLLDAGCAGLSNGLNIVENTLVMRRALQYAANFSATVITTPHDPWLLGNGSVHEGLVSTRLGLPAIPDAAETVGVARDIALIETRGVKAHFDLLSSARSVDMVKEARNRGLPLSAGVSINHLLQNEDDIGEFNTMNKVFPPFRTEKDRKALVKGLNAGVISTICSNHQPHGNDAKLAPFSEASAGMSSLDTLLSLAYKLVLDGTVELNKIIAALTINPARTIGIKGGTLSKGAKADLCIFDPRQTWTVNEESIASRGKNTPLLHQSLQGRVTHTWVAGNLVYKI